MGADPPQGEARDEPRTSRVAEAKAITEPRPGIPLTMLRHAETRTARKRRERRTTGSARRAPSACRRPAGATSSERAKRNVCELASKPYYQRHLETEHSLLPITLHEMRVREDDAAGAGVDADLRPECLTDEIPIWNGSELPIWNGSELQKSQKASHTKDMTYTSLLKTPGD